MKTRYIIILFLMAFLLQPSVTNLISIRDVGPNLPLVLLVVLCYIYDAGLPTLICGGAFALLQDICFSQYAGVGTLSTVCVCVAVVLVYKFVNRDSVFPLMAEIAAVTLLYNLVYWCILALGEADYAFLYMLKYQVFYMLYNAIIGCALYFAFRKWNKRQRKSRYYT